MVRLRNPNEKIDTLKSVDDTICAAIDSVTIDSSPAELDRIYKELEDELKRNVQDIEQSVELLTTKLNADLESEKAEYDLHLHSHRLHDERYAEFRKRKNSTFSLEKEMREGYTSIIDTKRILNELRTSLCNRYVKVANGVLKQFVSDNNRRKLFYRTCDYFFDFGMPGVLALLGSLVMFISPIGGLLLATALFIGDRALNRWVLKPCVDKILANIAEGNLLSLHREFHRSYAISELYKSLVYSRIEYERLRSYDESSIAIKTDSQMADEKN